MNPNSSFDRGTSSLPFDVLNPSDVERHMKQMCNSTSLLDMTRKAFKMEFNVSKGLRPDELEQKARSLTETEKLLFKKIGELPNNQSTILAATKEENHMRQTCIVYGENIDGKFDTLRIWAYQVKKLDQQKLLACGVGAAAAGLILSATASPLVGVPAGVAIAGVGMFKAAYDIHQSIPDVMYGYIFHELQQKHTLQVRNGRIIL